VSSQGYTLIPPPLDEDAVYPYRRVWLAIVLESTILFIICLTIIIIGNFIQIPQNFNRPISLTITLLPALLWLGFSWLREFFSEQPRTNLLAVTIITALVASAIGYPLVYNILETDLWAYKGELIDRIFAYTLILGVLPETLKYIVIRYVACEHHFRNRYDAIAYGIASAIGYATVLNLHYILQTTPAAAIAAIRIFDNTSIQITNSLIISYGLAEMRNHRVNPILPVSMIGIASLITGIFTTLRNNLTNTQLTLTISRPPLIIGFALSALVLLGIALTIAFLFSTSERQEKEAAEEF